MQLSLRPLVLVAALIVVERVVAILTRRLEPKRVRWLSRGAVVLLGVAVAFPWVIFPIRLRVREIQNTSLMDGYRNVLQGYFQRKGHYPDRLSEALPASLTGYDVWGHPVEYERKGKTFIVVSYGRDGRPDGMDYWAVRQQAAAAGSSQRPVFVCEDPDHDVVASDLDVHHVCGK